MTPCVLAGGDQTTSLGESGTGDYRHTDLTVNTDFAQVEADNQQTNLDRSSLFFLEKRRFFQERSSNFQFRLGGSNRLFHSRRVGLHGGRQVRILGGTRLVGREGPWDIGVLTMQTGLEPGLGEEGDALPSESRRFGTPRESRRFRDVRAAGAGPKGGRFTWLH